jgi:hypothetical protein
MNNPRQVWREERYQAEESNLVVHFSAMPESNGGSSPHCKLAMASEPESVEHLMQAAVDCRETLRIPCFDPKGPHIPFLTPPAPDAP